MAKNKCTLQLILVYKIKLQCLVTKWRRFRKTKNATKNRRQVFLSSAFALQGGDVNDKTLKNNF